MIRSCHNFYFQLLRWFKAKCLQQQPHLRRASAWWRKKRARTPAFGASKLLNHLFLHHKGADFVFALISFFYPKVKHPWKQHVSVEAQQRIWCQPNERVRGYAGEVKKVNCKNKSNPDQWLNLLSLGFEVEVAFNLAFAQDCEQCGSYNHMIDICPHRCLQNWKSLQHYC